MKITGTAQFCGCGYSEVVSQLFHPLTLKVDFVEFFSQTTLVY